MLATVPTLTIDGFVNNKHIQINKLFLYFLSSKYSQSNTFYGNIKSLDYILATVNDPIEIKEKIESNLTSLYKSYFDNVEIVVNVDAPEYKSTINIFITGTLTDNGETYSLTKELNTTKSDVATYNLLLDSFYSMYSNE